MTAAKRRTYVAGAAVSLTFGADSGPVPPLPEYVVTRAAEVVLAHNPGDPDGFLPMLGIEVAS